MDRKANEILKFLLDWNYLLTELPVNGSIPEIYFCFVCSSYSKGKDKVSWLQFIKYLNIIEQTCNGHVFTCVPSNSLKQNYEDPFKCFNRITYINRLALALLFKSIQSSNDFEKDELDENSKENNKENINNTNNKKIDRIPTNKEDQLKYLMNLIEGPRNIASDNDIYPIKMIMNKKLSPNDINDTYLLTSRSRRLEQLEYLLTTPSSSHVLIRERARLRTIIEPFYDCCEDPEHGAILSGLTSFDKSTNYCKLKEEKLKKLLTHQDKDKNNITKYISLSKCINEKLHFIPIIQVQTDMKLGDCSYLDTCHKMTSCRYIHYGQLMPLKFGDKNDEIENHKKEINENMKIGDFTRGEPISLYSRDEIPAQWINCDITKLDFKVLGNDYGAIIADPSWTIHMNLNYSSMKDDELLSLRMDELQTEGIFLLWVTGRTIETGRDFLQKWGYKVMNQITWIKTSQLIRTISTGRTGHWLNHSKEHLLLGIKGDPKWLNKSMDPQILISSTRETSRKPDELYGIVDRLVGCRVKKLEIFGRKHNTRPGWLTIGNQLPETKIIETELLQKYNRWCAASSIDASMEVNSQ